MEPISANPQFAGHLIAWFLLGLLAVALGLVTVFTSLVLLAARKRRPPGSPFLMAPTGARFSVPERHRPLEQEFPNRWLAIRSSNTSQVQDALQLANPTPCPLEDGLAAADEVELFVSPPIGGWTLVTGSAVPDPDDDVDACYLWLRELSLQLGEVQYFAVNRALGHHAWARLLSGEVFRAYAWNGEPIWTQGELTRAELDLGMRCHAYGESHPDGFYHASDEAQLNIDKLRRLAARWSIDPAGIDTRRQKPRPGIAGRFSPR